ncbi:hypothetical protein Tco_0338190, partial [Tanacetum coccineum]
VNTYPTVRGSMAIGTGGDDFVQAMVVAVESVLQHQIPQVRHINCILQQHVLMLYHIENAIVIYVLPNVQKNDSSVLDPILSKKTSAEYSRVKRPKRP